MKTLCITGVNPAELSFIEGIFAQAGMALPRPAQRDETLTINRWHEQIQSRVKEVSIEQGPVELGRVWEQLASDLFVSNLDQPVWGWSNVQSLALLDFWEAFDPQVRFVLVVCSAQRFIANALDSGEAMLATSILLEQWAAKHMQMIDFYHRFPQKAVLVDIDHCIDNPAGLLKVCQQSWQLGLSKVHFPSHPAPTFSIMSRFLAESLSHTDQQWLPLQNELSASATAIGTLWKKPSRVDIADAVRAYRDEKNRDVEPNVSAKELEKLRAAQQVLIEQQTQIQDLNLELSEARAKLVADSEASNAQLRDAKEEQNQVIANLKEVQEELDRSSSALQDTKNQLKDAQEEAELMLLQLHQVQEELEHYFLKYQDAKQELDDAALRWKRMLQRTPDYFDLESAEVHSIEGVGAETLRWRLKGLEAAGRKLSELELTTFIVDGIAGLELPRKVGDQNIIQRWPAAVASDETLVVAWVGDTSANDKLTETLRQLGRSDWDLIRVIITAMITSLNTPGMLKSGNGVVVENTPQALGALQAKLSELPTAFRFDELTLTREQVNHDYEHLWLNFRHVAIGDKRLFDFDFRISCANLRPGVFGKHPKLEFPETSGRAAFSEWFDESYDDFGPKLELRFALPEAMDMEVWGRLSVSDREFLDELVQQMPVFLTELETSGVTLKRSWKDWQQLVHEVGRILKGCSSALLPQAVEPVTPRLTSSRRKRGTRK